MSTEQGHIYSSVTCPCAKCDEQRAAAVRVGHGPLRNALAAIAAAQCHYGFNTRERRALDIAAGAIVKPFPHVERKPPLYEITKDHIVMPDGSKLTPDQMTRTQLVALCCWKDPNRSFTDEDCTAEFGQPATDAQLREIVRDWMRVAP